MEFQKRKTIKLYTNLGFFINEKSGKKKPIKKETIQEENYLNAFASHPNIDVSVSRINNVGLSNLSDFSFSNIYGTAKVGIVDNLYTGISNKYVRLVIRLLRLIF